jgi:hypothetical protein
MVSQSRYQILNPGGCGVRSVTEPYRAFGDRLTGLAEVAS